MITVEYLNWLFDYDKENGKLYWKNHKSYAVFRKYQGKEAGCVNVQKNKRTKYLAVSIDDKTYKIHRLIWFIETGKWSNVIDHINGNGFDNRISNLRSVSTRFNSRNRYTHRKGKLVGAHYNKRDQMWRSRITIDNKQIILGYYNTEKEAHDRYMFELTNRGLLL
jgi:serine/threonine-protein kinase RIO1